MLEQSYERLRADLLSATSWPTGASSESAQPPLTASSTQLHTALLALDYENRRLRGQLAEAERERAKAAALSSASQRGHAQVTARVETLLSARARAKESAMILKAWSSWRLETAAAALPRVLGEALARRTDLAALRAAFRGWHAHAAGRVRLEAATERAEAVFRHRLLVTSYSVWRERTLQSRASSSSAAAAAATAAAALSAELAAAAQAALCSAQRALLSAELRSPPTPSSTLLDPPMLALQPIPGGGEWAGGRLACACAWLSADGCFQNALSVALESGQPRFSLLRARVSVGVDGWEAAPAEEWTLHPRPALVVSDAAASDTLLPLLAEADCLACGLGNGNVLFLGLGSGEIHILARTSDSNGAWSPPRRLPLSASSPRPPTLPPSQSAPAQLTRLPSGALLFFSSASPSAEVWSLHPSASSGSDDLSAWTVETATLMWTRVDAEEGPRPPPRTAAASAASEADGCLYLFGGLVCDSNPNSNTAEVLDDLWRFDVIGGRWEEVAAAEPRPRGRGAAMVCTSGGALVLTLARCEGLLEEEWWTWERGGSAWRRLRPHNSAPPAPLLRPDSRACCLLLADGNVFRFAEPEIGQCAVSLLCNPAAEEGRACRREAGSASARCTAALRSLADCRAAATRDAAAAAATAELLRVEAAEAAAEVARCAAEAKEAKKGRRGAVEEARKLRAALEAALAAADGERARVERELAKLRNE